MKLCLESEAREVDRLMCRGQGEGVNGRGRGGGRGEGGNEEVSSMQVTIVRSYRPQTPAGSQLLLPADAAHRGHHRRRGVYTRVTYISVRHTVGREVYRRQDLTDRQIMRP